MSTAETIERLVSSNPGQMKAEEYTAVAETITRLRPGHTLVFGCGRDSQLWIDLAKPGLVVFVEDQPKWAGDLFPVVITRYTGTVAAWRQTDPLSTMDCWASLAKHCWDFILIDGPRGDRLTAPGRLGPIAFSAGCNTTVAVHDIHRELEREACARYFAGRASRTVHHLRTFDPLEATDGKHDEAGRRQ